VEVKYFLDHWTEIRGSDAMRNVWHQIRLGRHPGFEEGPYTTSPSISVLELTTRLVWPVIATHLEFKPQSSGAASSDKEDSNRQA